MDPTHLTVKLVRDVKATARKMSGFGSIDRLKSKAQRV